MSRTVDDVRAGRWPAFEIRDNGRHYKIFADGRVRVESIPPMPGVLVTNFLPLLAKEAA